MAKKRNEKQNKEAEEETMICQDDDYYVGDFEPELRLFSPNGCRNCPKERAKRYFKGLVRRVVAKDCRNFVIP